MLDKEIEEDANGMADISQDMEIPMILIGPLMNTTKEEWRRITYSFLALKKALEEKMKLPIQMGMIDCNNDVSPDVLESLGANVDDLDSNTFGMTLDEVEMREFRENGMF